ncbi:MAG TPA: TauD/TfdA family dioxygenase [Thermoanaerobaculia bacterium]|nr:TauD/TfdA family dioxygenase [Thermoanaerobaculia bacterium]
MLHDSAPTPAGLAGPVIRSRFLAPERALPLVVEPGFAGADLVQWARGNRKSLERELGRHGGILFRGFGVDSSPSFQRFVEASSGRPLEYVERSSPRSRVSGTIYTSTDYPPEHEIFLHNEQSYNRVFPRKTLFCCLQAARRGGETPVADSRRIYQRLDPAIRGRFEAEGYLYQRNLARGFGLDWQTAFQTTDPGAVEEYCLDNDIDFEWRDGGERLRTRQVRRAVARHPVTREATWFNHLTFFHVSTLPVEAREALLAELPEEDLPNHTYYADGSPIEPAVLEELRGNYREETVAFGWENGDVLLLDNMLVAHARSAFEGPRKVVVGMAEPTDWDDV